MLVPFVSGWHGSPTPGWMVSPSLNSLTQSFPLLTSFSIDKMADPWPGHINSLQFVKHMSQIVQVHLCSFSYRGLGSPQTSSLQLLFSRSRKSKWRNLSHTRCPVKEKTCKFAWHLSLMDYWTIAIHCFKSHGVFLGSAMSCSSYIFSSLLL